MKTECSGSLEGGEVAEVGLDWRSDHRGMIEGVVRAVGVNEGWFIRKFRTARRYVLSTESGNKFSRMASGGHLAVEGREVEHEITVARAVEEEGQRRLVSR